jgi:F-type H+-transporting ATPase subunit epsilon
MDATYTLEVLTPEKTVLKAEIVSLVAPGTEGFLGVLANHAPLITGLEPGALTLTYPGNRREVYALSGGFLEVSNNRAIVLADAVEKPGEIDVARAEEAKKRARERLKAMDKEVDMDRAELALRKSISRLKLSD